MKIVRDIAQLGNPALRQRALQVADVNSDRIVKIVENMLYTLAESNGVGLAAPQISESVRIIIIASHPSSRYPLAPEMEPVVMFNPDFNVISDKMTKDWESCLSTPGIRALVPRYKKIKITYSDQQEKQQELVAVDFIARIFQHEYDHLNGLVYLDRVEDNKNIVVESEFQKMMDRKSSGLNRD